MHPAYPHQPQNMRSQVAEGRPVKRRRVHEFTPGPSVYHQTQFHDQYQQPRPYEISASTTVYAPSPHSRHPSPPLCMHPQFWGHRMPMHDMAPQYGQHSDPRNTANTNVDEDARSLPPQFAQPEPWNPYTLPKQRLVPREYDPLDSPHVHLEQVSWPIAPRPQKLYSHSPGSSAREQCSNRENYLDRIIPNMYPRARQEEQQHTEPQRSTAPLNWAMPEIGEPTRVSPKHVGQVSNCTRQF